MAQHRPLKSRSYISKVAGTSNYQRAVATLKKGDFLRVVREPDNKHDSDAIRLDSPRGRSLGYLNAGQAFEYAKYIDQGRLVCVVRVLEVTGQDRGTMGVNIIVALAQSATEARVLAVEQAREARGDRRPRRQHNRRSRAGDFLGRVVMGVVWTVIGLVLLAILVLAIGVWTA